MKDQGLTEADGQWLVENAGHPDITADWSDAITRQQETIELLAKETGNKVIQAADLYDLRFQTVAADAIKAAGQMTQSRDSSRLVRTQRAVPQPVRRRRRLGPGKPIRFGAAIGPSAACWSPGRIGSATGLARSAGPLGAVDGRHHDRRPDRRRPAAVEPADLDPARASPASASASCSATVLALLSGLSRLGEAVLDGPIQIKRAIPSLALLPLLILWLGIGESMKITTITLGVFVPIYIHTHNGLRTIDSRYVELAADGRTVPLASSSAGWCCRARCPASCSACGSR